MVLFTKIVKTQRGEAFVAAGEVISILGRLSSRSLLDGEARRPGGQEARRRKLFSVPGAEDRQVRPELRSKLRFDDMEGFVALRK